jgi:hypothetical protein
MVTKTFAVDGSLAVKLCVGYCSLTWDTTGRSAYLTFPELYDGSYAIPVMPNVGLPKIPPGGIARIEDFTNPKTNAPIPYFVGSAINPSVYAYTREDTRRNLYRIQLP